MWYNIGEDGLVESGNINPRAIPKIFDGQQQNDIHGYDIVCTICAFIRFSCMLCFQRFHEKAEQNLIENVEFFIGCGQPQKNL